MKFKNGITGKITLNKRWLSAGKIGQLKMLMSVPVLIAALGYFVDIYDLLLFSIVRVPSLQSFHLSGSELLEKGVWLINIQMFGMLLGGIIWGVLGDKRGRLTVLFGSILLYSLANLANGFVQNMDQYAICRFIAGIGLAGELGAGITLVSEILPKEIRGYGTTLVASVGLLGAVLAYFVAEEFSWSVSYIIGGCLGLLLLIMRVSVFESGMFVKTKDTTISRGNFFALFTNKYRLRKYVNCILIGLPVWFVIGILITFAPEFASTLNISAPVSAGKAVMFCYVGLSLGDLCSGLLSQRLKSRKKVVFSFIILSSFCISIYLIFPVFSLSGFYFLCAALGFSIGYWALFVTIAAEQFGTNLRNTVATTVPNFVRGSVNIITPLFLFLKEYIGIKNAALGTGALTIVIALVALIGLKETFGKDLDYVES